MAVSAVRSRRRHAPMGGRAPSGNRGNTSHHAAYAMSGRSRQVSCRMVLSGRGAAVDLPASADGRMARLARLGGDDDRLSRRFSFGRRLSGDLLAHIRLHEKPSHQLHLLRGSLPSVCARRPWSHLPFPLQMGAKRGMGRMGGEIQRHAASGEFPTRHS